MDILLIKEECGYWFTKCPRTTEIIKKHQLRKTFSSKKEKQKQKKNLYKVITDKLLSLTRL